MMTTEKTGVFKKGFDFLLLNPYVRYIHEANIPLETYSVPERTLYDFGLIYVWEGKMSFEYAGKITELKAGDCHIMPPLIRHREFIPPKKSCKYVNIHFDMVYCPERKDLSMQKMYLDYCKNGIKSAPFDESLVDLHNINYFVLERPIVSEIGNSDNFMYALEMLQMNYEKNLYVKTDLQGYLIKKYMIDLLTNIFDKSHSSDSVSSLKLINSFIYKVSQDISQQFDYDEFAKENGYTPNYFRSVFKKVMGVTPWKYVKDTRMKKAEFLLTMTNLPIKEIAYRVGVNDPFYFSKIFKDTMGIYPSEYRKGK